MNMPMIGPMIKTLVKKLMTDNLQSTLNAIKKRAEESALMNDNDARSTGRRSTFDRVSHRLRTQCRSARGATLRDALTKAGSRSASAWRSRARPLTRNWTPGLGDRLRALA